MTRRLLASLAVLCAASAVAFAQSSAERGAVAVRSALNPAVASMQAYENIWKQWGLKEKPADFDKALRERYGLHAAPYANHGLPMGLAVAGKGVTGDCLMCHAGSVAGQTIIGLGNASIELHALLEELARG